MFVGLLGVLVGGLAIAFDISSNNGDPDPDANGDPSEEADAEATVKVVAVRCLRRT
jgi:hypothetical protein